MLIFFDESFRKSQSKTNKSIGIFCGIGIPEQELYKINSDIFELKLKHFSGAQAKNMEIKGKEIFKNYIFKLESRGIKSRQLALGIDLLEYIVSKKLPIFGCVCFEDELRGFQCVDVYSLDKTFFFIFERINIYMKREQPNKLAKLILDDRGYTINKQNSEAITNFLVRSPIGLAMDSIIKTPFFAISQAQNVGLQLADVVNTVIGLKFASVRKIEPYWQQLKRSVYKWRTDEGHLNSTLKVLRGVKKNGLDDSFKSASGQENPTSNP